MDDELVTTKGLELKTIDRGDIVTVTSNRDGCASYSSEIFEVLAVTSSAVVLVSRFSGTGITPPGTKVILRLKEWRFYEASELLEAVDHCRDG